MSVTMRFGKQIPHGAEFPTVGNLQPLQTRIRAAVRRCIADEIERLVDVLDALDGDTDMEAEPDIEDGGDNEPSLGWTNQMGERLDAVENLCVAQVMRGPLDDDRELDEAEGRLMDAGDERESTEWSNPV